MMLILLNVTAQETNARDYDQMIQAASIMQEAMDVIKNYRLTHELSLQDPTRNHRLYDFNETGLLGYATSPITTTDGDLAAKRTTTNPNFAALVVKMFKEAGLKAGDGIAVLFSGSFPAINIAIMSAIEAMELDPYVMVSIGASSFGANLVELTYFDMAHILVINNVISNPVDLVSFGGEDDVGRDIDEAVIQTIRERILETEITLLEESNYQANIIQRMEYVESELSTLKLFVNVGGNMIGLGKGTAAFIKHNGLIFKSARQYSEERGLIDRYLEQNIPVAHFLNIASIVNYYGLPIDPASLPIVGMGEVYIDKVYSLWLIGLMIGGSTGFAIWYLIDRRQNKYVSQL